ncbi:MAG: sensor histidine kinase [Anaerolineae bacterium]|nr:sensor histidine kinase [Anaerolineae bacterium]
MVWLRDILASCQMEWTLLQGQVFFVLGISILFLTRGGIRLELARELASLAAFGFLEAVAAWLGAWLAFSGSSGIWLDWVRLAALALAYVFLLTFALQVMVPAIGQGRERWLIAGGILLLWTGGLLLMRLLGISGARLRLLGEIAARYGMALPGGLLGAWGLRHETYRTIEPDRLPLVKPPMRVTELALGAFALVGGVIVPSASFFPANFANEQLLFARTGVPISVLRAMVGVGITFGVVRAVGVVLNEIEMWLEGVEQTQALVDERERIGRDLHDGIIQSIYASGLILEGARQHVVEDPQAAREQLTVVIKNLNETIQDIRRYIFDLRGELPQEDLHTSLRKMLQDFRVNTLLETEFSVGGPGTRRIDVERRQHVVQIVREALTNVARHADAQEVAIRLEYGPDALRLSISDDGIGLSSVPSSNGHGLRNIRERTRLLNGKLDIDTTRGEGLTVLLTVPYQQRVTANMQPCTEVEPS